MIKNIKFLGLALTVSLLMPAHVLAQDVDKSITSGQTLEKITSPTEIKNYEKIEKRGNVLFGVKKKVNEIMSEMNKKVLEIQKEGLKKKDSQEYEFESGKKIQEMQNEVNKKAMELEREAGKKMNEKSELNGKVLIKENRSIIDSDILSCVISAVTTKDRGYIEQETLFSSTIVSLITKRGDCQQMALKSVEKQKENLNLCAKNFREGRDALQNNTSKARQLVQETYRTSLKACAMASSSSEVQKMEINIDDGVGTESKDEQGGMGRPIVMPQEPQTTTVTSDGQATMEAVQVPSSVASLEKITSPTEIKNYEKIEKRGNTLYGIRKRLDDVIKKLQPNSQAKPLQR